MGSSRALSSVLALCRAGLFRFLRLHHLFLLAAALLALPTAQAATERYEYDGLGRLIRVIDAANKLTEYQYDAAGNILAVRTDGTAQPPTATGISPASLRRGSSTRITLNGTQLATAALTADDPELGISRVSRSAGSIAFDLAVSPTARLGASALRLSSAAGTASISLQIRPLLPVAQVAPLPIAVSPSAGAAGFDLTLSHADDEAHQFTLAVVRADIATVSPLSLSLAAGQTAARFAVRGLKGGNTELRLSSPTLGVLQVPIFVTINPEGISTARAALVGVEVATVPQPPSGIATLLGAPLVGVHMSAGSLWLDTQPRYLSQGATQTLRILGESLPPDLSASLEPAQGLTLGTLSLSADRKQAELPVTVDAAAATGLRSLVLQAGGVSLRPVIQGADDIDIVLPRPQIFSVAPIALKAGSTVAEFVIRGRNLQDVSGVEVRGATGLRLGSTLSVSPDGSSLTVGLQVLASAVPGPRVIVLSSPSGLSDEGASAANTVTVYEDDSDWKSVQQLSAGVVGVLLDKPADPGAGLHTLSAAPLVGVTLGTVLSDFAPRSIAKGETRTLVFSGEGLQGVDALGIEAATGLTVGAISVAPDGRSVSVAVTAASDAPLGLRRLKLVAAGVALPFAAPEEPLLLVTPVLPVLDSIEPPTAKPGSTIALTLRGRNFLNAQSVQVSPAAGVSIGSVNVDAEGKLATVSLIIDAAAAKGARTVTLQTPAGSTSATPGPNNQLTLGDVASQVRDLQAAAVGVLLGADGGTPPPLATLVTGSLVGVQWEQTAQPREQELQLRAATTGVVLGAGVLGLSPAAVQRGQSLELVVSGVALPEDASLQLLPATGLVLQGAALRSPDGSSLRQTVQARTDAPLQPYELIVLDETGKPIPVLSAPHRLQLEVLAEMPEIVSIEPILARQGDVIVLRVRGKHLQRVQRVEALPGGALVMGDTPSINADGSELTIPVAVRADAPTGAYTIRVFNPIGGSSALASPANTFTVYVKEATP
ncbi:MAG: RHS repeat domain-containing protein [Roseateles asaccharophilus]|uniref:RHS repeat domain-containing protein n=1 Tax=Roseateles asaccharophilus TaxID=582607 RepID=UPI00391ACB4C